MSNPFIKYDLVIVGVALVLSVATAFGLYYGWTIWAYISVAIVDLYFIYVILYAGRKSDKYQTDSWKWGITIPHKFAGVFVFVFLYLSALFGLAEVFIDQKAPDYTSPNCALYKSWIAITSFSYDDYSGLSWKLQKYQMWQAFSGILLLTATFGFLISRISSFKENKSLEEVYQMLEWLDPPKDKTGRVKNPKEVITEKEIEITTLNAEVTYLKTKLANLEGQIKKSNG